MATQEVPPKHQCNPLYMATILIQPYNYFAFVYDIFDYLVNA